MYFDNLFRQFNNIQFQSKKIWNAKVIDQIQAEEFASYVEVLKNELLSLNFSDEITRYVQNVEWVDPNYQPKPFLGLALVNILTLGWYSNYRIKKKRQNYFKTKAKILIQQFANIDMLIKKL